MALERIRNQIEQLRELGGPLHTSDLLRTWLLEPAALEQLVGVAQVLEQLHRENVSTRLFDGGLGLSIFRDMSTRTRYAFRSGCNLLGLMTEELDEKTSQIAHGETVRETATMISFATEAVGIRDDIYLGHGHRYMSEFARSLQESHDAGVLAQRPPVVNLQCDLDHPTQALSDLMHLADQLGGLDQLQGKKLVMSWAYSPSYGKPLSVAQGIIGLMSRFGMDVVLAHPEGYELVDEPLAAARRFASDSGGSFSVSHSMAEAFDGAHVIYPKSWAPLEVMRARTELRGERASDEQLAELERRCLQMNSEHKDWHVDEQMLARTHDGDALYMHCLPADISGVNCEDGEVSEAVFERYRLRTYREASHKPFVVAAAILCSRFASPADALSHCVARAAPRRWQ